MSLFLTALLLVSEVALPRYAYTYVNYSPDRAYTASENEHTVSMAILMDRRSFGLGHSFDVLKPCALSLDDCVAFSGMAVKRLPLDASVGKAYKEGKFEFKVISSSDLSLVGQTFHVLRVDVSNDGIPSNAYLFDRHRGVLAIVMRNADNQRIPESTFLLSSATGLYSSANEAKDVHDR